MRINSWFSANLFTSRMLGSLFLFTFTKKSLKVQSRKLCNNKYMIASTQITNTEIFAFIAVLGFVKFRLLTEKTIETVKKLTTFKNIASFKGKLLQN